MRLLLLVGRWGLALAAVVVLAGGGGGYLWLRRSLPQTSGSRQVQGVAAPVTITRDADGVAHIVAQSEADALFGQGYVHAQERLWQMEFQRRVGFGRLSEVLGEATLETDRFLRTLGTGRAAVSAYERLDPPTRALLDAYAAGVNAYLAGDPPLPIEFTVLGFTPEPWRPTDSLVWAKMMAWDLGGNWSDELLRAALSEQLGPEAAAQLMPTYTPDGPVIVAGPGGGAVSVPLLPNASPTGGAGLSSQQAAARPPAPAAREGVAGGEGQADALSPLLGLSRRLQETTGLGGKLVGSNNWVVAGSRTTTGMPLLADDPHLGARIPSIWYLAHLKGGAIDAIGATLPGIPGVVIGHNGKIAWGVTNTGPDVQDLFIERIDARGRAEYRGQLEPVTIIPETIVVKGADEPVELFVRVTRHGPIISDVTEGTGQALAFRWTALDEEDNTLRAFLGINRAGSWAEFTEALRDYKAPMQNFVYADVAGNIGYYAPGALPIRAGGDGTAPVPGWTGEHDWVGYVPHEELPQAFNPPAGYIATANNRAVGDDYPHLIASSWAAPYRAARIVELIEAKPKLSPDDMAAMHADVTSAQARELLPYLLEVAPADERGQAAIALLRGWDGTMAGDSAAAAVYQAYYLALPARIFGDELRGLFESDYQTEKDFQAMLIAAILAGRGGPWCDNVNTPATEEPCGAALALALEDGLATMAALQGSDDPRQWRWDRVHHTVFPHTPFSQVEPLRGLFERRIPNGGDGFTVNVAPIRLTDLYNQYNVPSYRQIIDLAEIGASRFMHTTGQSGNVLSGNYSDYVERWQQVAYLPMRYSGAEGEVLTLTP